MKFTLTKVSLILLAITLIYVGGFSMLHSGGHQECAAANIVGGCSGSSNFFGTATMHLDVLKRISMAALGSFALGIFAIFLVLFLVFSKPPAESADKSSQKKLTWLYIKASSLRKQLDWLITREKRDPANMFAVSA